MIAIAAWSLLAPAALVWAEAAPDPVAPPAWQDRSEGIALEGGQALLEQHPTRWVHLRTPTVWEAMTNLVAYRGALYGVGSTIYVNHNSADVYRYDPHTDTLRFETKLFSQDAGQPAVHDGLLVYPAEDSRFSAGVGEFALTNGQDWAWRQAAEAPAIHFHALASHEGRLYAAAAAWNGLLYRRGAADAPWQRLYSHPTPRGRVTRLNGLLAFRGELYVGGFSQSLIEPYLFRLRGDALEVVPGVPPARWVQLLATHENALLLALVDGDAPGVYRFDGRAARRLALPASSRVSAALSQQGRLVLAGRTGSRGQVWVVEDGRPREVAAWPDREPVALARAEGRAYLGMRVPGGRGELWVSANAGHTGYLYTRPIAQADWWRGLRVHAPPDTRVDFQVADAAGTFAGANGDPRAYHAWGEALDLMSGKPLRLKIRLTGTDTLTPYLVWRAPLPAPPPIPPPRRAALSAEEVDAALGALDALPPARDWNELRSLRTTLRELAATGAARVADWIEGKLAQAADDGATLRMFGGGTPVRARAMAQHYLLLGLALTGRGRVPPALWEQPFTHRPNRPEKFYAPHEAAVFAAGVLGQRDPATVRSLVGLLERADVPLWLKGDAVGALTAITGRRFGYDFTAWRAWLADAGGALP